MYVVQLENVSSGDQLICEPVCVELPWTISVSILAMPAEKSQLSVSLPTMPSSTAFDLALAHLHEDRRIGRVGDELVLVRAVEERAGHGQRAVAEFPFRAQLEVRAFGGLEIGAVRIVGRGD